MRGVLNAGHERSGAVVRSVGEDFEVRAFPVFGAMVIAGIGRIPDTLEDRSITIELRRRLKTETIERLRHGHTQHLADLARRSARFIADIVCALESADPELPDQLGDRAQDNWRPLIAIADAIGHEAGERARCAAKQLCELQASDDDSVGVMALADVAAIFEAKKAKRLPSQDVLDALLVMEDRPWRDWYKGKPLTLGKLARLLKPFKVRPKVIKHGPATVRGYEAGPIQEAKERFVDVERKVEEADLNEAL